MLLNQNSILHLVLHKYNRVHGIQIGAEFSPETESYNLAQSGMQKAGKDGIEAEEDTRSRNVDK